MKTKLATFATLLLALWGLTTAAWGQVRPVTEFEVRVLPQAEVIGERFTLGEIAELDGFDIKALEKLARVGIGPSPRPGRALRINESLVRARLAAAGIDWPLKLMVPTGAQVLRAAQIVTPGEIERIVLEAAEQDAKLAGGDKLKQQILTTLSEVVLPRGRVQWKISLMGEHLVGGGTRVYRVSAHVNGREAWKSMVRVRQKIYRRVLIAKRPIRRNQKIAAADLAHVRKNISANRGDPYLTSITKVVGRRAKRPIGRNQPLHNRMLSTPMDVAEGGRVTVVYESGRLLLRVPGVAMVQGRAGQFIPVRNLETGKIVHGILQDDETVKVN